MSAARHARVRARHGQLFENPPGPSARLGVGVRLHQSERAGIQRTRHGPCQDDAKGRFDAGGRIRRKTPVLRCRISTRASAGVELRKPIPRE